MPETPTITPAKAPRCGWFVIDSITYTDSKVTAIDARFEQRCNGVATALNGRVRWSGISN